MKRVISLLLVVIFLLATVSFALAENAVATTMRLEATTGTVTVKNSGGVAQTIRDGMRLYNGYTIATGAQSEAYISLDSSKAVKLGASGKAQLKQSGKQLEVSVSAGELFFNVTAPLKTDESLNVRTSTMVTGVRGSFGWVSPKETGLIHGSVILTYRNSQTGATFSVLLHSGELARADALALASASPNEDTPPLAIQAVSNEDIPTLVARELSERPELLALVKQDVPAIDAEGLLENLDERIREEEAREEAAKTALDEEYAKGAGNAVKKSSLFQSGGSSGGGSSSSGSGSYYNGNASGGGQIDNGNTNNGNTPDDGKTDNGNTPDDGKTDSGNSPDDGKTDNGNTSDGGKTDNGNTPDDGKTDNGNAPDDGKTDHGNTPDDGKTDHGNTPDDGKTDHGNTPDDGKTDNWNTPDDGKTDHGNTPDDGKTDHGNTPDDGKTDHGNTPDDGKTDDGNTPDDGKTDDGHTEETKEQLLKKFSVTVMVPEQWQSLYGESLSLNFRGPDEQNALIVPVIVYYAERHSAWEEKAQNLPVVTEIELADGASMSPAPETLKTVGDCYALKENGLTVTKGAETQFYTFQYSWKSEDEAPEDWEWNIGEPLPEWEEGELPARPHADFGDASREPDGSEG